MACLTKSNNDNYITFNKVIGEITLAELQEYGIVECSDINTIILVDYDNYILEDSDDDTLIEKVI
jgi:hypothetical protein